jgi:hypothetical protein
MKSLCGYRTFGQGQAGGLGPDPEFPGGWFRSRILGWGGGRRCLNSRTADTGVRVRRLGMPQAGCWLEIGSSLILLLFT